MHYGCWALRIRSSFYSLAHDRDVVEEPNRREIIGDGVCLEEEVREGGARDLT